MCIDDVPTATRSAHPVLLLIKGQPGSGKSTLARLLCSSLGWPLVDKDDARSSFQHCVGQHPQIDWNGLSYEVMFRVADTQLRCGLSLVVDCPLARRALFDRAVALATKYGAEVALVELVAGDEEVWRRRVEQRGEQDRGTEHEHKPGSWADVQAVLARNSGSEAWSQDVDLRLHCGLDSTAGSTEQQLAAVLKMLQAAGVPAAAPGGG